MNAHKVPITVLQVHPTEECVATGDEIGKIFLWRQFTDMNAVRTVNNFQNYLLHFIKH